LGTKYLVVLCAGSTLPLAKQSLDEAPYKLSKAVAKLASITFSRIGFLLPGRLNLGFITEGKLAAIFIKPSLGVSNWSVIYYIFPCQLGSRSFLSPLPWIEEEASTPSSPRHQQVFWRRCWGSNYIFPRQLGAIKHHQVFWRRCR
jgi:hypothetical protein